MVEHFKYLGSLKSADGNCSKATRFRIGMAKKIMLDLVQIWKDVAINKDLKMKLVRSLLWTALTWALTKADEKRIQSAELWIYRRMLRCHTPGVFDFIGFFNNLEKLFIVTA